MTETLAKAAQALYEHPDQKLGRDPVLNAAVNAMDEASERIEELEITLQEAMLQLEYLHEKFPATGSGEMTLVRIKAALDSPVRPRRDREPISSAASTALSGPPSAVDARRVFVSEAALLEGLGKLIDTTRAEVSLAEYLASVRECMKAIERETGVAFDLPSDIW